MPLFLTAPRRGPHASRRARAPARPLKRSEINSLATSRRGMARRQYRIMTRATIFCICRIRIRAWHHFCCARVPAAGRHRGNGHNRRGGRLPPVKTPPRAPRRPPSSADPLAMPQWFGDATVHRRRARPKAPGAVEPEIRTRLPKTTVPLIRINAATREGGRMPLSATITDRRFLRSSDFPLSWLRKSNGRLLPATVRFPLFNGRACRHGLTRDPGITAHGPVHLDHGGVVDAPNDTADLLPRRGRDGGYHTICSKSYAKRPGVGT